MVGLGGFAGSVLRYLISRMMLPCVVATDFPFSTLTVNVVGSLLIGGLFSCGASSGWYLLCVTGFCGGFTTFSTFSLEVVTLLKTGNYGPALLYVMLSLVLSVLAVWIGLYLGIKLNSFK